MKISERYRIHAVRLVEFHNLGTTTVEIPVGGHLFLLGDNGSGKTTLLDAIHLVLTAGREMEFNSAARVAGAKDSGGRTYQGIVLRYNAVTGRPLRESGITYAALELHSDQGRIVSIAVGLAAEGMDVAIDRWGGLASVPVADLPLTVEENGRLRARTQAEFKKGMASLTGGRAYTHINEYADAVGMRLFGSLEKYADVCKLLRTGKAYREIAARAANYDELFRQLLEDPPRETFEPLLKGLRELDASKAKLEQIDERAHYLDDLRRAREQLDSLRLKTDLVSWAEADRVREKTTVEIASLAAACAAGAEERTNLERQAGTAQGETARTRERLAELRAKDSSGLVNQEKHIFARLAEAQRVAATAQADAVAAESRREADARAESQQKKTLATVSRQSGDAVQKASKAAGIAVGAVTDVLFGTANGAAVADVSTPFVEARAQVVQVRETRVAEAFAARQVCETTQADVDAARQELETLQHRGESLPNVPGFEAARRDLRSALLDARPLYELLEPNPSCDARHLALLERLLGDEFLATWIVDEPQLDATRRLVWREEGPLTVASRADQDGVDAPALAPGLFNYLSVTDSDTAAIRLVARQLCAKAAPQDFDFLSLKAWNFRSRQGVFADAKPRLIGSKARAAEQARLIRAAEERLAAAEKANRNALRAAAASDTAVANVKALESALEDARTELDEALKVWREAAAIARASSERATYVRTTATERLHEAQVVREELEDVRLRMRAAGIDGSLEKKIAAVERKVKANEEAANELQRQLGAVETRLEALHNQQVEADQRLASAQRQIEALTARFAAHLGESMDAGAFVRTKCPEAFSDKADFAQLRENLVKSASAVETEIAHKIRDVKGAYYAFSFDRVQNRLVDRRGEPLDKVIAEETASLDDLRSIIDRKTREVFEQIFMGEIMDRLNVSWHQMTELVSRIQRKLTGRRFGSNRYAFEIETVPEYEEFVNLVKQAFRRESEEGKAELQRILENHRDEIMNADFDRVPDLFDYRKWFRFQLKVFVENTEGRVIDRKVKSMGSGGEQAVPNYLLILTVAEFLYHGGDQVDPPKVAPLLFDEAFYGIDAERRDQLLAFADDLGLQLFVSSPDQDGVKREIRHSVSLIVVKDENLDVHLSPIVWNNVPTQGVLLGESGSAPGMEIREETR
ncbi:MAG: hypothetical protein MJ249_06690 [Kiritimatiellae bacterium]|nr:hypothetical protein [Kiritimatiellia bacterium]